MRKKLTKLMAVALALVMVAALVPAIALAEDEGTAAELSEAISSATGTLKLEKDYKIETTAYAAGVEIKKDLIIDLNGHKITGKAGYLIRIIGADVTITNTSSTESVVELTESPYGTTIQVQANDNPYKAASLTLSGKVEVKGNGANIIGLTGKKSQVLPGTADKAVNYYASLAIADENVKVTGSETTAAISGSLGYGSLTISNGTFTGAVTGKNWDENSEISGGSFTVAPDSALAKKGYLFEKGAGDKYTLVAGFEASIGSKQGSLSELVEEAKTSGEVVTVAKSGLTLKLNRFGTTDPEPANMPTIKLKLGDGVESVTLTTDKYNGLTVCKITVENATSESSVVTTGLGVSGQEGETTEYKLDKKYDQTSKTVTITVTRTMKAAFEVTYIDGRVVKYNLKDFFSNANLKSATKVKLLEDVALELEATDKQQQKVTQHMSIRLDDPVDAVKAVDGGKLTFDLNGKTLTYKGDNGAIVSMEGRKVDIITSVAGGTIDASAAKVAISLGATISAKELPDGQGGTKTVTTPNYTSTGSAVIGTGVTVKGTVGIFNEGSSLEVSGTIDGGTGIAISGNGSQDATTGDNHGGTTVTIKEGGKVISSGSAAVYQPQAGETKVEGGEITGAAGIVALDGSVDVTGGTIEATGQSDVTLPCGAVPASGIVAENNQSYGDAEKAPSVSVSGSTTTVKSATAESVTYRDTTENEVEPDITVSGGTFTSKNKPDETVNTYVDPDMVVDEETGKVEAFSAEIVDFGYEESAKAAVEKAKKSNKDLVATDWIDQTMWVTFKEPLPAGKKVELTLTFNGGKANGENDLVMTCVGDGEHKTFAWSFLNKAQTEGVKAKAGTYAVSAKGVTGGTPVKIEKIPDNAVKFAPTTNGSKDYADDGMTVTVKEDDKVGQYYEVRFDTEKLSQTTGSGNAGEAYWLGWALVAPNGAEKYAMTKAARAENLTIPAVANGTVTAATTVLEKNVDGKNGEGLALYYKANDTSKDSAAWVAVTWTDTDGKPMGTTFIHVVFGNITYKPANSAEINAVEGGSGFKADKAEAEKAIKAGLDKISSTATVPTDVIKNTLWAIFQHDKVQETAVNYTYRVRKDGSTDALTSSTGPVSVANAILLYFSLDDQLNSANPKGGKYVIELLKDNLPVANAEVEVFEVTYVSGKNVATGSKTVYTDKAGLEAALKAHPEGFEFTGGASMWEENKYEIVEGTYTYEVTLNAYTYVAPPMPGTDPDNPDNPDNPPATDPAKQFVDVPDVAANKWYRDALNYVLTTKPGVIEGTDGTHFSPNAKLTRAAFAKILWALDGKQTPTAANPFTDVKAGAWYYDAVIWANAEGIMLGDAGRCKPEDNITREEMAVMIQRWLNKDGKATTASKFTDAKDIHDWAADAVAWAAEQGYIKGKDNGTFAPLATLTRAEMIVVVARTQGWIG